ncbi:MAG TPA: PP2C family protein-serine/threonine phosphatase [Thermoanaerobaculia bacterium]|nr:PP2C family protein-serine/threonine phosphatase [Thermoanaerobaculia bacterium]
MKPEEAAVRQRLADRRERLAAAAGASAGTRLVDLLRQVDSALGRLDAGEWPVCTACRVLVEPELLDAAPAVRLCFECLTADEVRALERDLEGAARVQRALLPPRRAAHDGWEVAWLWEPKGAVSGDHVDLLPPRRDGSEPDPCHLLVGDVSGKGVAASLLQSHLHALFRALTDPALRLAELLGRANHHFAAATVGASYATLVFARLFADGTLELANAGHPRPLLANRRGVRPIEGSGLPLGLFAESAYTAHRLQLEPGEVVLVYTDGWTEAARGDDEYGIGRAAAALRRSATLPLPDLLAACRRDVTEYLDGEPLADDLTLVAVRRGD